MWIYTTGNEMINITRADRIELRQETKLVASADSHLKPGDELTGISIVAHLADGTEALLAFIPATPHYDVAVTRYWNAIRTAIKANAAVCDLMDIG
jgi:hypothetical protein